MFSKLCSAIVMAVCAQEDIEPISIVPQGEVCKKFRVSGVNVNDEMGLPAFDGINGVYEFINFDDNGFPVYAYNDDEHFLYVGQTDEYYYWHFNYVLGEPNAWMYSHYTQNCPPKETATWYYWGDRAWSETSSVKFELLE